MLQLYHGGSVDAARITERHFLDVVSNVRHLNHTPMI